MLSVVGAAWSVDGLSREAGDREASQPGRVRDLHNGHFVAL
jgi:hypothetical protein